jgi:hypothetical protein
MLSLKFPKGGPRTATSGPPPFLNFIYAANRVEHAFFGEPEFVGNLEGQFGEDGSLYAGDRFEGYVEEYKHARVLFPKGEESVLIVAKTVYGEQVMRLARLDQKIEPGEVVRPMSSSTTPS